MSRELPKYRYGIWEKDTIGGEDMYFRRKTDILDVFKSRLDRHIFKNRHYETPHRNRGSPETFNCTQIIF